MNIVWYDIPNIEPYQPQAPDGTSRLYAPIISHPGSRPDKNVKHSSHLVEKGATLTEGIFKLSKEVDADLIAIMNLQDDTLLGILENSFQEEIVANDLKVPVLSVHPIKTSKSLFFS